MNPGPVEEAGKVATGIVDSLKGQPMLLALVLMNFALLGLIFWIAHGVGETREREVRLLYENSQKIAEILSHCIVPDKRTDFKLQSIDPPKPLPTGDPPKAQ